MTNAAVASLREPGRVDPRTVLTGPLVDLARHHLAPGETMTLRAVASEYTLFVLAGAGVAGCGGASAELRHGVSVTLPLGSTLELTAGEPGLQLFLAELAVPEGADS